jgi:hypothetical protein
MSTALTSDFLGRYLDRIAARPERSPSRSHVQPTLEVVITESPEHLRRETDEETGLPLGAVRD